MKRARLGTVRVCVQCEREYEATQEHRNYARRFCSRKCSIDYKSERTRESWPPEEEMRRLYEVELLSDREIGRRFGHSYQWALTIRKAYGIEGRKPGERKLRATPRVQSNGYVKLGDRWEHRVVMEGMIGRPLRTGEVIHHADGNPTNNDPKNLVLYPSHSEHMWDERGRTALKTKSRRRDWTEPRQKVEAEGHCRVCGRSGLKLDAAHIIPRSRVAPGPGEHVDNIVPLCAERCHPAFDTGGFDLLPYLTIGEQAYATRLVGMLEALQRTTNRGWLPGVA